MRILPLLLAALLWYGQASAQLGNGGGAGATGTAGTTGAGSAATCDVYVYGNPFP